MQTPAALPVRVVANPLGGGSLTIDGTDYSEGTTRLWFEMGDGPSVLVLERRADAVVVEGAAVVQVAAEGSGHADAVAFLQALDYDELEQKALADAGLGGGKIGERVLALAIEALEQQQ